MFEFPGAYYEIVRRDFRNVETETAFLEAHCPAEGRVLDLGCGTGTNLRALAARGRRCVGVDQSRAFIEYARSLRTEQVVYEQLPALNFEADEQFDLITCLFVTLNYMAFGDVRPLFEKVASWLAPDGHFVLDIAHLLNFVESYRPYVIAHHEEADVMITRFVRHDVRPLRGTWKHDEMMLVSDAGAVSMFRNSFEQTVLTVPTILQMLGDAGLRVVASYGGFDVDARPGRGGDLVLVAQRI